MPIAVVHSPTLTATTDPTARAAGAEACLSDRQGHLKGSRQAVHMESGPRFLRFVDRDGINRSTSTFFGQPLPFSSLRSVLLTLRRLQHTKNVFRGMLNGFKGRRRRAATRSF